MSSSINMFTEKNFQTKDLCSKRRILLYPSRKEKILRELCIMHIVYFTIFCCFSFQFRSKRTPVVFLIPVKTAVCATLRMVLFPAGAQKDFCRLFVNLEVHCKRPARMQGMVNETHWTLLWALVKRGGELMRVARAFDNQLELVCKW